MTSLSLDNNGFTGSLPSSICQLTKLATIILNNNRLTQIPNCIGELPSLYYLDLSSNPIYNFALPYGNYSSTLRTLYLRNNKLSSLSLALDRFTTLNSLDVSSNLLQNFPSFTHLSKLSSLIMNYNKFQNFPSELLTLTSLSYLDLSVNSISETNFPTDLIMMSALSNLRLDYNKFKSIPEVIFTLNRLTLLNLANNQINGTFPDFFSSLTNILSLDLSSNRLSGTLPSSIFSMIPLYYVNLRISNNPNLCDNLYSFCHSYIKTKIYCDVSDFWSCSCKYSCTTSSCQTKYTTNHCLENFSSEFGTKVNGTWIINSTIINLLNFLDLSNINGSIVGNINTTLFAISNSTIQIEGTYSQSSGNLTLQNSNLIIKSGMNFTGGNIFFDSLTSNIQVTGDVNLSKTVFYLDMNKMIPSNSEYVLFSSNKSITLPIFHLINQDPSDCSSISYNQVSIILRYSPCPNNLSIIVGSVVGSVVFLSIIVMILYYLHRKSQRNQNIKKTEVNTTQ
uniref:Uncharacterized protein n=1 Tax=Arcella intermedia TaxID=1963864 RepID=A0A6B2L216_9EUKA